MLSSHDAHRSPLHNCCSHDDGPLNEGTLDASAGTVKCPRHSSIFDLRSGRALRAPPDARLKTFPVHVEDEQIRLEVE